MTLAGIWESIPRFDEIRVLDRPFDLGEAPCLLLGLTREGGALSAWILFRPEEEGDAAPQKPVKTRRDELIFARALNQTAFAPLDVSALVIDGERFLSGSGEGTALQSMPLAQAFVLRAFLEAGLDAGEWRDRDLWEAHLYRLELDGEYPSIPLEKAAPREIRLEFRQKFFCGLAGKRLTLDFTRTSPRKYAFTDSHDGSAHSFYLTRAYLWDPWPDYEALFADPRMIEQVPPEILAEQRRSFFEETLPEICPKGMRLPVVEYESEEGLSLDFYSREFLAGKRDAPQSGGATAFLMKPDKQTGPHGFPLRAAVIQTRLPPETEKLEAEALFYHLPIAAEPVTF